MNTGIRLFVVALLGTPLTASFCGCAKPEVEARPQQQTSVGSTANRQEAPAQPAESQAPGKSIPFTNVLAAWESGAKDDAVKQFVSIQWNDRAVFAGVPALNVSEDGFKSLDAPARTQMLNECIKLASALRAIARHALAAGDQALASGDKPTAKIHYEAVRHFGEALTSPERVLVIQQLGKGIVGSAQEKESGLK
ncbi:MAG: hypothetical protein NTW96_02425 [Planctomycetia bacterium]|nr:hypothetical protein [Planctomycetia bacterium]